MPGSCLYCFFGLYHSCILKAKGAADLTEYGGFNYFLAAARQMCRYDGAQRYDFRCARMMEANV